MKVEPIQSIDWNTYWSDKRKKENKKRKQECKVYNEIENGVKNKKVCIDWRV